MHRLLLPFLGIGTLGFTFLSCQTYVDTSGAMGAGTLTANSIGSGGGTSVTFTAPTGTTYSSVIVDQGSDFLANNISSGKTIFGLAGTASCAQSGTTTVVSVTTVIPSGAARSITATQITSAQETSTYAGTDLPSGYRDIPVIATDDETGDASSVVTRLTRGNGGNFGLWNAGAARKQCGMGIATVAGRISDCDTQHSTKPSWDTSSSDGKISWSGTTSGFGVGPEASWTLVTVYAAGGSNGTTCNASNTLNASCREVWRDDRTGLLWSDRIGDNSSTGVNVGNFNWCIASGNTENASLDCRSQSGGGGAGVSYNYVAFSLCAESTGLTTPVGITTTGAQQVAQPSAWTENGTAVRDSKGGMMKTANTDPIGQSPSIRWRLPTKWDYQQADNDGIRLVLPNLYTTNERFWSSTVYSSGRANGWTFDSTNGDVSNVTRSTTYAIRCVGR